jgi:hypothetical protein|nr:MAG TPA: hypothetical protein [Caudoviricetes sp.]DAM29712.1 MAG TPA: hypothetical protein [Caudoviricetes sp.]
MFQKSEKQKICDWVADVVQHNVQILNELSGKKTPKDIEVIENDGNKYIALEDVHKLLDDRFEKHRLLGQ